MRRAVARWMPWWLRGIVLVWALDRIVGLPAAALLAYPVLLVAAFTRPPRRDDEPPAELLAPVRGRWSALNSPADKVPSHGVRAYGQSHAVDILHPRGDRRPGFGLGMRRPEAFSTFGEPVRAMADGTVVRTCGWQRDHRSRESWWALAYLLVVEGFIRELAGGPRFVLGNHVIVDHGEGRFAAYAHLRRGSLRVAPGERVEAGQVIGEVGNSGNSSEPHLHVHLMDHPTPTAAAGLPLRWRDVPTGGGMPPAGAVFEPQGP
ncbi:MAG TPA: M23 family metallopeptidase [Acidimicrobiales bacterium]|nr:M23 family metallopeptidase [Acidimicrobiales bacterium]